MTHCFQLFTAKLEDDPPPARLRAWRELLSPEELVRGDRYIFERHRQQHVIAHALKRLALSRFQDVDPRAWRFAIGEHGKPSIVEPASDLHFNLSHTEGLAVCLVARGAEVGVDVENVDRRVGTTAIAERFFAPPEVADLRKLPEAEQRGRFFQIWTLKEAYIKARGLGLAIPLASFWFTLAPPAPPALSVAPPTVDDPARWRFFEGFLAPGFRIAAAIDRSAGEPDLEIHPPDGKIMDLGGATGTPS